jgi:multiple sugar transport system permease protein
VSVDVTAHVHASTGRRKKLIQFGRYLVVLVATLVVAFPIYWLFIMAFKSAEEMYAVPPVYFPSQPDFGNFRFLFQGINEDARTLLNSLIIATSTTVITMVLGTMCAYSMARFRTGGHNFAIWIMSQRMLPPIAIVFPLFLAFAFIDILDTFPSIIAVYVAFNLPFVIWMMRGYIEDIPVELEESALVDGCTRWQVLYKVILPMARAGVFATAVFTFIFTWNEFVFALVLSNKDIVTYPVQVTGYFAAQQSYWNKVGAMSILGSIPVFFAVIFLQRFLVRGISMGAVKG